MSYILEALKKSDAERKRGEVPTLGNAGQLTSVGAEQGKSLMPWVISAILGAAVIGLTSVLILRPDLVIIDTPVAGPTPAPRPTFAQTTPTSPTPAKPVVNTPAPISEPVSEPTSKLVQAPTPPASPPSPPPSDPIQEKAAITPEPDPVIQTVIETVAQTTDMGVETTQTGPTQTPPPAPEPEIISEQNATPEPVAEPIPVPETKPVSSVPHDEPIEDKTPEPQAVATPTPAPAPKLQNPSLVTVAKTPSASKQRQHQSAKVLVDKAWSSIDKGFYNQALRDLKRAVDIEPGYADAWFARGWTNEKSGNELSAIGDYGRAIAAKPDHAFALFSRGYLNLYVGSAQNAVTDFVRTQGVAQDQSLRLYSHLWLYLSRTRTGQDAITRLSEDTVHDNLQRWPGPLIHHFLGQAEESQVITAMSEGTTASHQERQCTGYFFLGISALHKGDAKRARHYFEKALATGAVQFRQYDAAKRELDKLNR